MPLWQWQKIDPTAAEIEAALAEAARSCGARRPTKAEREEVWSMAEGANGSCCWPPRRRRADAPVRQVSCAWWSDHLGRRHWFIEGDEYPPQGDPNPLWRCRDGAAGDSLYAIDPYHVVLRGEGLERQGLVVCDCGVVGTAKELGWTGDCCAPCFDRRAEGIAQPARTVVHAHRTFCNGLAFTADGWLSLGWDGSIQMFQPESGEEVIVLPASDRGGAGIVSLSDGSAIVAFIRSEVVCWDMESGKQRWRRHCPGELMGLALSPKEDWLAVDAVTTAHLLDTKTGEGEMLSEDLSNFAFGHDGALFACDVESRGVSLVDLSTGETTETGLMFGEPEVDDCYSLACSPTRPLIAAGCSRGVVRLGNTTTGRWLRCFQRQAEIVSTLAFSPDGRTLASAHHRTILFCDLEAGAERGVLALPGAKVSALAFSPDGEHLAVGDDRGVVRVWPWRKLLTEHYPHDSACT